MRRYSVTRTFMVSSSYLAFSKSKASAQRRRGEKRGRRGKAINGAVSTEMACRHSSFPLRPLFFLCASAFMALNVQDPALSLLEQDVPRPVERELPARIDAAREIRLLQNRR